MTTREWDNRTYYGRGDTVTHEGKTHIARHDNYASKPGTTSDWFEQTAVKPKPVTPYKKGLKTFDQPIKKAIKSYTKESGTFSKVDNASNSVTHFTKGEMGVAGKDGIQGSIGPQGFKGEPGKDGIDGQQGPRGFEGKAGPTGLTGAKGDKGDTGLQGIQGLKGDKGDKGDQGPAGRDGKDFDVNIVSAGIGSMNRFKLTSVGSGVSLIAQNAQGHNTNKPRVTELRSLIAGSGITITSNATGVTIAASGGSGSGTVTSVSVATGNGFAGTVANPATTPAITISTTVTGLLIGNGTAISAAVAGVDYQAPISLTTTGTSGAATFSANVLNIPNYASGVTTTGTPSSGNLTVFSGTNTITNGNLSGDATTTNTLVTTVSSFNSGTAFGTAAGVNTGTSGATIPLNNGNNTFSGTFASTGAAQFTNANNTFGGSVANSTSNFGSGATTSPNVKAINIGTNGTSGSTTNIAIGSAVVGALGGITFNQPITANANYVAANGASIASASFVAAAAGSGFLWSGRSRVQSDSDGSIRLSNSTQTGFTSLLLGGTTASFPALFVSGTIIQARLADNSADAPFTAASVTSSGTLLVTGNAAASLSNSAFTGTIFTGGTGTTSFPFVRIEPATSPVLTNWATVGTLFGINSPNTTSLLINAFSNSVSRFSVDGTGNTTANQMNATASVRGVIMTGSTASLSVRSDGGVMWNSTTNAGGGTFDVGIDRSAANVLEINNGTLGNASGSLKMTNLTTSGTNTLSALTSNGFVKTSGGTGLLSVDTNAYLLGTTVNGTASSTSSTTLTNVTGMSVTLAAAGTYAVWGYATGTGSAAGGSKIGIGGTATYTLFKASSFMDNAGTVTGGGLISAAGALQGVTAATAIFYFDGLVVVNASGTITFQYAQNVSSGTASTLNAAFMCLNRIS